MKKSTKANPLTNKALAAFFFIPLLILPAGCNASNNGSSKTFYKQVDEDAVKATINSLVSKDIYGRTFAEADVASSDRLVGMFYFVWHGEHTNKGIFDVTKFKNECPDELWDVNSTVSPLGEFHYFDEPLYGYYKSSDPWVIRRHVELLTMSGIDYISLDLTNWGLYEKNVTVLLDILKEFQDKGWKVPLVTSILNGTDPNANHPLRIKKFYDLFYTNPKYDSLWLRNPDNNKPYISITMNEYLTSLPDYIREAIFFRNTIWPYDKGGTQYNDTSWMDWTYPQRIYDNEIGGYMSVSVAQHNAGAFGYSSNPYIKDDFYNTNRGRGWNYDLNKNVAEDAFKGTNIETQWRNALNAKDKVDEVFVTGWNEWIAYKLQGKDFGAISAEMDEKKAEAVSFCDTCDDEFSRDLEMTKRGYGDNFYLQNMRLTREFKTAKNVKYYGSYRTSSLNKQGWTNARTYLDFEGDATARNFLSTDNSFYYTNNTNRNDIVSTSVSNDDNYLYIQVETKDNIVIDNNESNNLNILLSVEGVDVPKWEGYNFILNRTPLSSESGVTSLEKVKSKNTFDFEKVSDCKTYRSGNFFSVAIPIEDFGLEKGKEFTVDFKVADGMSNPGDIMNYYIDGDSAPIGRLNYRYNSKHK